MSNFLQALNNPAVQRGLLNAGISMLKASEPSATPRSFGGIVADGMQGYLGGMQDYNYQEIQQKRNLLNQLKLEQDLQNANLPKYKITDAGQAINEKNPLAGAVNIPNFNKYVQIDQQKKLLDQMKLQQDLQSANLPKYKITDTGQAINERNPLAGAMNIPNYVNMKHGTVNNAIGAMQPFTLKEEIKRRNHEQELQTKERQGIISNLDSMKSKLPQLRKTVKELSDIGQKATYTLAGRARDGIARQLNMDVGEGAIARAEYVAKIDNQILPLLRDTFGAAFTQKEGETLRATLGDPNLSPAEKDAVLEAFINQKTADIESQSIQLQYSESRNPALQAPQQGGQFTPISQQGGQIRFKFNLN